MDTDLTFRILGPLEVARADQQVAIRSGKQRVVLAALLLRANRTVSIEDLVDKLWDGSGPVDARGAVQKYVMRLRATLVDDVIRTEPAGYRIDLAWPQLDLNRFTELTRRSADAANAGTLADESRHLREALGLWRDVPPLSNVASASLRRHDVEPLLEAYLQALERRIEIDLRLGANVAVVGELMALVDTYPLRERFRAQLMRALNGSGRQGEALSLYRLTVRFLAEELGVDPGDDLRAAHEEILRGRSADSEHVSARPNRPDLPRSGFDLPARQLPIAASGLSGRHSELETVTNELRHAGADGQTPVVVLTGLAGVGKTALAIQAAHLVAEHFPDGQLYADFRSGPTARPVNVSQVLGRFLYALGLPSETAPLDRDDQVTTYRSLMAGRRILVVLDNVVSEEQVRPLLPGTVGCAVLVTSRHQMAGLIVSPGATFLALGLLATEDACGLVTRLAGRGRDAMDEDATRELVELCGNLPLALRVAAAHLASNPELPVADYVAQLRARGPVSTLSIDGDKYANVAAAFDLSYQQLAPESRRLFRLLSLIPGADFTVGAAAALAGVDRPVALRRLEYLAAAGLLGRASRRRYQLQNLIREFARDRCHDREAGSHRLAARERLFGYYIQATDEVVKPLINLSRLPRAYPTWPTGVPRPTLASLDEDRIAMVAAVRDAAEHGPHDAAYHLADALRGYFILRGHSVDWFTTVEAGLRAARRADHTEAIAAMLNSKGSLAYYTGTTRQATELWTAALELYQRVGSAAANAVRIDLGVVEQASGDIDTAVNHLQIALTGLQVQDEIGLAQLARENLVLALIEAGALGSAELESAPLKDVADRAENYRALGVLAMLATRRGDLRQAVLMLKRAARTAAGRGDHRTVVGLLDEVANCYLELGMESEAHRIALANMSRARRFDQRNVPHTKVTIAASMLRQGRISDARSRYREVLALVRDTLSRDLECAVLMGLAELELAAGRTNVATGLAAEASAKAQAAKRRLRGVHALVVLARCQRSQGELRHAAITAEDALSAGQVCEYPLGQAMAHDELAHIAVEVGDNVAALQHWQRAEGMFRAVQSRRVIETSAQLAKVKLVF